MNDKFFLDTNVLIYTFDTRIPAKQQKARQLVTDAITTKQGLISFQVIQEFLNVASRKFAHPLSPKDCQVYLDQVLAPLCEVFPSIDLYNQTIELTERWGYSFYDCLIITAALEADCKILYSEDFQHQQKIQETTIINPFV